MPEGDSGGVVHHEAIVEHKKRSGHDRHHLDNRVHSVGNQWATNKFGIQKHQPRSCKHADDPDCARDPGPVGSQGGAPATEGTAQMHQKRGSFTNHHDEIPENHSWKVPRPESKNEQAASDFSAEKGGTDEPVPPYLAVITKCE